jgi:hypothetical protein
MMYVNKCGERHRICTFRYNILRLRDFLTLPTNVVSGIVAQYSAHCWCAFIALYCEFISIQWRLVTSMPICYINYWQNTLQICIKWRNNKQTFEDNYVLQKYIFNVLSFEAGDPNGPPLALGSWHFATHTAPKLHQWTRAFLSSSQENLRHLLNSNLY